MEYKTYLEVATSPEGYTRICNKLLMDKNVSLKAKGTFSVIVSLSTIPEWDFSVEGLISLTREGETAIRSAIKELKETGYLKVDREKDESGRITKFVYRLDNLN